jgi:hypothetical protein
MTIEIKNVVDIHISRKMAKVPTDPVERMTIHVKTGDGQTLAIQLVSCTDGEIRVMVDSNRTNAFDPKED